MAKFVSPTTKVTAGPTVDVYSFAHEKLAGTPLAPYANDLIGASSLYNIDINFLVCLLEFKGDFTRWGSDIRTANNPFLLTCTPAGSYDNEGFCGWPQAGYGGTMCMRSYQNIGAICYKEYCQAINCLNMYRNMTDGIFNAVYYFSLIVAQSGVDGWFGLANLLSCGTAVWCEACGWTAASLAQLGNTNAQKWPTKEPCVGAGCGPNPCVGPNCTPPPQTTLLPFVGIAFAVGILTAIAQLAKTRPPNNQ